VGAGQPQPYKDGYGRHWEWEGHKPYWWCPDDDLCGPHPTKKAALACYMTRKDKEQGSAVVSRSG
jgi:hypothetical protein